MLAYVLISLCECDEKELLQDLMRHKESVDGHILFGEWDLILKIKTESPEHAGSFVMEKIRSLEDVKLTSTHIVAK